MKILIADDSRTNRSLIVSSLQKLGHEAIAAESGEEALDFFIRNKPDLVILDVVMGGMDGYECAKHIREIANDDWIPIIFLSSSVDDSSIAKGIDSGGDDYLAKPFSDITLEAKIKAMQRIAEMRRKLFNTTEELRILSSTDTLTGLYNRLQFEKTIKEKLSEADRYNNMLTLLFIDLDNFKSINDSLGHHIGDLLLKEVSSRLKLFFALEDFVARLGGDEFIVLLSHISDRNGFDEIARELISLIARPYILDGNEIRISASVGIAFYPDENTDHFSFIQHADLAMYHAKNLGRNNYQYFNHEISAKYQKQISIETELQFALDRKQLTLCYQPIYNLITKEIVGVEALMRWNHPEIGLISPNVFIPIAEEMGLIIEIGNWAFRNACVQAAKWYRSGVSNIRVSINVSIHQIMQENFFDFVKSVLAEVGLPASMLELELTETSVITYTHYLKSNINELHHLGIGITVDDFGTKYSSLTSLKYLTITAIKIDKLFMRHVTRNSKNSIIVKSLIALGNSLHINVIAEGIQTNEELDFLVVNGCHHGQGYLLSKPITANEMTLLLESKCEEFAK